MNENYELMQTFLDIIKELAISNPGNRIDAKLIYTCLMGYSIKPEDHPYSSTNDILKNIEDEYQSNNNLDMIKWGAFLVFEQGKIKGNEIKLYVPLDKNHMQQGSKELMNFLISNNIENEIKFANKVRNDNVVIRVNTLSDVEKIVNFVSGNEYIKKGLLKTNPFLPNTSGVGVAMDNNYSYNTVLAEIISNYIVVLGAKGTLDELSVEGLNSFVKEQSKTIENLDLKDIYNLIEKITSRQFKFLDVVNHIKRKMADKYDDKFERIVDSKYYFEEAVKVTYKKHPNNVSAAILSYIDGEAKYFTNEDNVRLGLIKYVEPRNIVNIMRTKLIENNVPVPSSNEILINSYLEQLLSKENEKQENLNEIPEILRAAYINTYKKYGERQANDALKEFIKARQTKYFTNDGGYRDKLRNHLAELNPKKIVLGEIDLNGLDKDNITEIVNRYSASLSYYTSQNNKIIQ